MGDGLAFQAAGVVEVEVLQRLAGREPGGPDAALAAVGLAGGDLALQAGGQELLMGPGLVAGPLGQPVDRLAQRGRLQRAGQVRQLGADVRPGAVLLGGHQAIASSRSCIAFVVRSGARCSTSASRRRHGRRRSGPGAALPRRRRGSESVIVWCPAHTPCVSATTLPVAARVTRSQVGADLDPAADHGRVDRVVVGVDAHVVVPRQAGARVPADLRRHRRQRQHRGPVRSTRSSGRQPSTRIQRPLAFGQPGPQLGVEVDRDGERPPGQERRLEVVVGPLQQTLRLRVGRACR